MSELILCKVLDADRPLVNACSNCRIVLALGNYTILYFGSSAQPSEPSELCVEYACQHCGRKTIMPQLFYEKEEALREIQVLGFNVDASPMSC